MCDIMFFSFKKTFSFQLSCLNNFISCIYGYIHTYNLYILTHNHVYIQSPKLYIIDKTTVYS